MFYGWLEKSKKEPMCRHFSPFSPSRLYPYRVAVLLAPSSIRECHLALSCTSSCSKPKRLMSDFTVSFHRCRGLPLLLLPPTCIFVTWRISSSSSLRQTCPCHCKRLFLMYDDISFTLACLLISVFSTWFA